MVSHEMFRAEKSEWVQGVQCPSCKEKKIIEEGDRDLITTSVRIEEVD